MEVKEISYKQSMKWCLEKHYARRKPMYQFAYGLIINGMIEGVVVYGRPPIQIEKNVLLNDVSFKYTVYELTRLVIQTDIKNGASFLVGNSLKMLPKPNIIVSYADTNMGHCGIIYQATNWLYTGGNKSHDCEYIIDGKKTHPKTITERMGITSVAKWAKENNITRIKPKIKHRYFYINSNKKEKKEIMENIRYGIKKYPKTDKQRYDSGDKIVMKYINKEEQLSLI